MGGGLIAATLAAASAGPGQATVSDNGATVAAEADQPDVFDRTVAPPEFAPGADMAIVVDEEPPLVMPGGPVFDPTRTIEVTPAGVVPPRRPPALAGPGTAGPDAPANPDINLTDLAGDRPPELPLPGWNTPGPGREGQPGTGGGTLLAGEPQPYGTPSDDEQLPFRAFERQQLPALPTNPVLRFLETAQGAWFNRRRSYGGLLAFIGFAIIAGVVVWFLVRDLRSQPGSVESDSTFTTFIDSSDGGGAEPTAVPPVLLEPASTNETTPSTRRPAPRTTTTTAPTVSVAPSAAPGPGSSGTPAPTTAPTGSPAPTSGTPLPPAPTSGTIRPPVSTGPSVTPAPSGSVPPSATPSTGRRTTTTTQTTGTVSAPPQGLTQPLIDTAEVSRIRATSARIGVTSSSCVTARFTYGQVGAATSQISSSACATAHTLLLGIVTPSLTSGTAYTVTVTVTDAEGRSASQNLSFTTLG